MVRRAGGLLKRTLGACIRDNTPMLAAGLSFYTLLSLAPALWVIVGMAGAIVGRESARANVMQWATRTAGPGVAGFLGEIVDRTQSGSSVATIVGVASMLFGATLAFAALHDSLNLIWRVERKPGRGFLRGYAIQTLLAFAVVVLAGLLILATLLLQTALAAVPGFLPVPRPLLEVASFFVAMVAMVLLFAGIYRFLHSGRMDWHDVWMGAAVTAVLFAAGNSLIGFYVGRATFTSVYGAAGSLVVLLLWVYYSAQIFLFGAEFTEVYAKSRRPVAGARGSVA